jgi:hypothetical protein
MVAATHHVRRLVAPGLAAVTAVMLMAVLAPAPALAADPIDLGTAADFSVLAFSTVTNAGPTTVEQDIGLSPGSSVTGFPPGTVEGDVHINDAATAQARLDLAEAYNDLTSTPAELIPGNLSGMTLTPGAYGAATSLFLNGELILDAEGNDQSVFILRAGSTLTMTANSSVTFINGASPCNVFWQTGTSATLGSNTTFGGSILAQITITVNAGASVDGRLLSLNGAVTMDNNAITEPICPAAPSPPPPLPPPAGPPGDDQPTLPVTGGGRDGGGAVPMLTAAGGALVLLGGLLVALHHRRRVNRYRF